MHLVQANLVDRDLREASRVSLVTGTTNIEGGLVRCAHGPGFQHVVLV